MKNASWFAPGILERTALKIFWLLLVAVLLVPAVIVPAAHAGIKYDKPDPAKYEGYPAAVLHKSRRHEISFGYTGFETKVKEERVFTVLTRDGVDEYGTFQTDYYLTDNEIKVKAQVIQPDGKKMKVKGEHMHETKLGDRWRRKTIVFPGLSPGAIVEMEMEQKISESFSSNGSYSLGEDIPVARARLEYKVPIPCKAAFAFTPREAGRRNLPAREDGDHNVYTVEMTDLLPYKQEPFMPPKFEDTPSVAYMVEYIPLYFGYNYKGESMISNKTKLITWGGLCSDFKTIYFEWLIGDEGDHEKYRSDIRDYIEETGMPDDFESDVEKINWITERVREDFKMVEGLFFFDSPHRCLEDRSGTNFSVSYVLRSILEELDFTTTPVFVVDASVGEFDRRITAFEQFTDVLLLVQASSEQHWLAPAHPRALADDLPWNFQGILGIALHEHVTPDFKGTPLWSADKNQTMKKFDAVLNPDGSLEGSVEMVMTGAYRQRFGDRVEDTEKTLEWLRESDRVGLGSEIEAASVCWYCGPPFNA